MWKIDKKMAVWGVCFGILATLTGMFLLSAVQEGFYAEGFFLIVLSWIVFPIMIAMFIRRMMRHPEEDGFELYPRGGDKHD
ncbi:MAG TPA: hypothetical protein VGB78_10670 [Thermoplasmata archaeon]|jgi:Na+/glutamate symporter